MRAELVAFERKVAPLRKPLSKQGGLTEEDGIALRRAATHDHAAAAPSDTRGVSPQIPQWGCFAAEPHPQARRRTEIEDPHYGQATAFHLTLPTLRRSAAPRDAGRVAL